MLDKNKFSGEKKIKLLILVNRISSKIEMLAKNKKKFNFDKYFDKN